MPGKKKKFINKKDAVTFHLVHRSQKDPLLVSDEASQHVLVQGKNKNTDDQKEEERKYGVFYEDDYDYMQHLKDTREIYEVEMVDKVYAETTPQMPAGIQLPSSAMPSEFEKPVGLLNQALPVRGPQPDWDPDIVEALDDDFNFSDPDNQLEDDFMQTANAGQQDIDEESEDEEGSDIGSDVAQMSDNDDFDTDFKYGDQMFMDEETRSRFTNYSMSSSVIRRNQGLSLLDDRFEKLFEEYDDTEIGALDQDDIDGSLQQGSTVLNSLMDEFEKTQKVKKLAEVVDEGENLGVVSDGEFEDSDTELVTVEVNPTDKWDCESILSTYSNIYNHPRLIEEPRKVKNSEIRLMGKHGIPEDSVATRGLSIQEINTLNQRETSDKASTYRPKDETSEERIERKKAIKDERKERRQEKKQNKKAFSKERVRQNKELTNVNNNLKGVKIA